MSVLGECAFHIPVAPQIKARQEKRRQWFSNSCSKFVPRGGGSSFSALLSARVVAEARTFTLMRTYASIVASPLWTDREDNRAESHNYGKVPKLQPEDIAEVMMRLIEDGKYGGGTVLVKSVGVEQIVFDLESQVGENSPLARTGAQDISPIKAIMDKERGMPWKG